MKRLTHSISILLLAAGMVLYGAYGQMERNVVFQITMPEAKTVVLYGSFDGWSQGHPLTVSPGSTWKQTLKLERGRYEYKFLIDGRWMHNPELPVIDDGFSDKNNVLIVR